MHVSAVQQLLRRGEEPSTWRLEVPGYFPSWPFSLPVFDAAARNVRIMCVAARAGLQCTQYGTCHRPHAAIMLSALRRVATRPRLLAAGRFHLLARTASTAPSDFVFSPENFVNPNLPSGLAVLEVEAVQATPESMKGFGYVVDDPNDFLCDNGTFEIVPWPHVGWRPLDPKTGDEAGTVEGDFEVHWVRFVRS